ncbi:endonuclease/exonuclease/phosphatase family protein [Herbiconiux sp. L3-i23]|uniref:endonuclease/exonuclease/phosphatase family protein n=1 Tax=Herbiconiux sp. L3-i23 TaxID=2905871 RepID=UPI0020745CBC|nr:endonuclease/exonuclease/phosphatase family protein [Herbiconiux sp. L3-i23]
MTATAPRIADPRDPVTASRRPARRRLNAVVVVGSLVLAALLAGHALVPDVLGLGLLLDSILPWLGLLVIGLAVLALLARRGRPIAAVLVPAVVWCVMFVPALLPLAAAAPSGETLTVASQNIKADSATGVESATELAATGADVIALQEMDYGARNAIADELSDDYGYSYQVGTVGLWSTYPIANAQPLQLGLGWNRALAADLETPSGPVSIYVIHAGSARLDDHADRDTMLAELAATVPNDENDRVVVVGDFNAASNDRALAPLQAELSEANQTSGGLGFTWPSWFPATRLDHVFTTGVDVVSNETMVAGDSDHLALLATLGL